MELIQFLEILTIAAAGIAALIVLIAWQAQFVRVRLMTVCLSLGLVALLFNFLLGGVIPIATDSLDFTRGLSLGLGVGLFLGIAALFLVEAMERKRKAAEHTDAA